MDKSVRAIDECLSVRGGRLFIEDCDTVGLAERFGTPVFVISEDQLRRNMRRYLKAFSDRWREGEVNILPAIKANWLLALRRILTQEGAGCDVYSAGELHSALQSGIDPRLVSVNGGGKSREHLTNCIRAGVRITVDDIDELELIEHAARDAGGKASIRLRLRPDFPNLWQPTGFANELVPIDIGFQVYKNGIPTEHVVSMGRKALASEHIDLVGVHIHLGRHHYSLTVWEELIRRYVELITELKTQWGGWEPSEIDIGGGIPSPRDPFGKIIGSTADNLLFAGLFAGMYALKALGEKRRYEIISRLMGLILGRKGKKARIPSIEEYAERITATLKREMSRCGLNERGVRLQIEPGRSMYGNTGIHLSRVLKTKYQTRPIAWNWVLLDTTYFFMAGGVFENNLHPFIVANRADEKPCKLADIVGRSCYADRMIPEVRIPDVKAGDIFAVLETGAYQEVSASNFNAMPRPATVLVTGDQAEIIKRAETQEEVFARDIVPERLLKDGGSRLHSLFDTAAGKFYSFESMTAHYTPILAGVAQYTQPKDVERPLDPMGLMVRVCRAALEDASPERIGDHIDALHVVNLFQWPYRDAPGMLSEALGIRPKGKFYTPIGGNTPQLLVNRACRELASGEVRAVLITGAEAICSVKRALAGRIALDWPESSSPERIDGDNRPGVSQLEADYDLFFPAVMYPLFETALRASSGRGVSGHREYLGRLWERFSRAASENPHAWVRKALSAREITEVTPENRYINYPYTKYMNANINVDQAAAVLMTTEETARRLGIDPGAWVYPLGGADLCDVWNVSRRPRLDASPAIRNASRLALEQAGLDLGDIDFFDIYSCFPSAVQIAMKEIGIPPDDPRDLTVTGGLAFFGGPGNNYSLHGIASAAERIRESRSEKAMVTANGWYITKHSVGIYGGEPPERPWTGQDDSSVQAAIDKEALPEPVEEAEGDMKVEAYVIRHGRDGSPTLGTVIGRLSDGRRALAHIDADAGALEEMERTELVGSTGHVRHAPGRAGNLIRFHGLS